MPTAMHMVVLWSVAQLPCVFCSQLSEGIATFVVVVVVVVVVVCLFVCLRFDLVRYCSGLAWHCACVIISCRYD